MGDWRRSDGEGETLDDLRRSRRPHAVRPADRFEGKAADLARGLLDAGHPPREGMVLLLRAVEILRLEDLRAVEPDRPRLQDRGGPGAKTVAVPLVYKIAGR
jgi:hypothetical protein